MTMRSSPSSISRRSRPRDLVLLIDTYDTERAAERVVGLAQRLAAEGITVSGVRLDSGDLGEHARRVRRILDAGGLRSVDDRRQRRARRGSIFWSLRDAPINSFGVGTSLTTSSDAPALDCAYKLQEYAGRARRKRSEGKATWPGRKQVWRSHDAAGVFAGDLVSLLDEQHDGEMLLKRVMSGGRRTTPATSLDEIRAQARDQLAKLPGPLKRLEAFAYPVEIGTSLRELAERLDGIQNVSANAASIAEPGCRTGLLDARCGEYSPVGTFCPTAKSCFCSAPTAIPSIRHGSRSSRPISRGCS